MPPHSFIIDFQRVHYHMHEEAEHKRAGKQIDRHACYVVDQIGMLVGESASSVREPSRPVPAVKSIFVGAQSGKLTAGTGGQATFEVTTENIGEGEQPTIKWSGGKPEGIRADITQVQAKKAVVTVTCDYSVQTGRYEFSVSVDGTMSNTATLVIESMKTVTVDTQTDTLVKGQDEDETAAFEVCTKKHSGKHTAVS